MPHTPRPRHSADPAAHQGGDLTHLAGRTVLADLSLCTNRETSPAALQAANAITEDQLRRPPYGAAQDYLIAYATHLAVSPAHMLFGRGVTEFLAVLARLLRGRRVGLVAPEYTGTRDYFDSVATCYAPPFGVHDTPEQRYLRLHQAMQHNEAVIYSNPNNPLGHYFPPETIDELLRAHPETLLVLDEEYIEFQGPGLSMAGHRADNLAVMQSTGKAWGLAGTRAGMMWTRNAHLRAAIRHECLPWPSQPDILMATAALGDEEWLRGSLDRARIQGDILQLHLARTFGDALDDRSSLHFQFLRTAQPRPLYEHFLSRGVVTRCFREDGPGRPGGLRIQAPATTRERAALHSALRSWHGAPVAYPGKSVILADPLTD